MTQLDEVALVEEDADRAIGRVFDEPFPLPVDPRVLPRPGWRYRFKVRLLGAPLHSAQLEHETLGKPTALAVFASDNLSSAAYATEEILAHLVPFVGVAAFALLVPTTVALLVVLRLRRAHRPPLSSAARSYVLRSGSDARRRVRGRAFFLIAASSIRSGRCL